MNGRYPLWVDGNISLKVLTDAFAQAGLHVSSDTLGRMVADPIPSFLRREPEKSNVLHLPARPRKAHP